MTNHAELKCTMYGLSPKSCNTIKKACRWLEAQQLRDFIEQLGWQPLLNTRGTTWRKLDETQRNTCDNADAAIAVMLARNRRLSNGRCWTTASGTPCSVSAPITISNLSPRSPHDLPGYRTGSTIDQTPFPQPT